MSQFFKRMQGLNSWKDDDRPELACEWTIQAQNSGVFLARSEIAARILRGAAISALLPQIDGHRTVAQLVRLAHRNLRDKIRPALDLLETEGLITRQPAGCSRPESAYWRLIGADDSRVARRREQARCRIIVANGDGRAPVEEALCSLGITVTEGAAFRLVLARDYLDDRLAAIDDECCAEGGPWMLVRPFGRRHWIGPLFIPGKTACWKCFCWWLTINGWSASAVIADLETLTATTLRLAAFEVAKWLLTGHNDTIQGRFRELDTTSLVFTGHQLIPRPGCPRCGTAASTPVDLRNLQSPLTGVAASLDAIREWPGLVVYAGETSQKVGIEGAGGAYYASPQTTFGVAETTSVAATTCLAEAVERFSARFQGDEAVITASFRQLGSRALSPAALLLPVDAFGPDQMIGWVEATSLLSGEPVLVPAAYVYLGYDSIRFEADTNGCAAGVTLEAAVNTAILELIERDAVAMWWYNRARRPAVDLEKTRTRRIDAVLAAAHSCGKRIHILDLTTDFGVPTCIAVGFGNTPGIALGCAANLDPEQSIWKALAEMSTGTALLTAPVAGRQQWLAQELLEHYLHMIPCGSPVPWSAKPEAHSAVLTNLVDRARRLGIEILVVNLTRPELGIPVVRAIMPGLLPLARRLAPGRLYDVPPRLGWVPHRLTEAEMNPEPFQL